VNARHLTLPVVMIILLVGAACVSLRISARRHIQAIQGGTFWRVSYTVSFKAAKVGARLHAAFPPDTAQSRVYRHYFRYAKLRPTRPSGDDTGTREVTFSARREGKLRLAARFDVQLSPPGPNGLAATPVSLSDRERKQWLQSTEQVQADSPVVVRWLCSVAGDATDPQEVTEQLFRHCQYLTVGSDLPNDAVGVLDQGNGTLWGRARAMVALCRAARLPARLVQGLGLAERSQVTPHMWVEVFLDDHWQRFDLERGASGAALYGLLPLRYDGADLFSGVDVADIEVAYAVAKIPPPPGALRGRRHPVDIVDLSRLPLEMHEPLEVILLMPLGALLTAIFRTIIGISTFGTFTPSLIALAFVYNDWRTGVVVFIITVMLGLASRSLLDRLKLLLVPRLSIILTLVVLCMVFGVSLLQYFDLTPSTQAVLLPMVILTMTVERFYLTSEEDSVRHALRLLAGTLLVSFLCYLVLRWRTVGAVLLLYPEMHLFTVGVLILLGRYTGYRLTELWRFRDLVGPPQ
jgi:hypothetical protein